MNKRCIVNVATGDFYCKMQDRLLSSFLKCKPEMVTIHFDGNFEKRSPIVGKWYDNSGFDLLLWRNILPPGSRPHSESPYGFKVHALKAAYEKGYTSILWVDSPAHAVKEDVSPIFEKIEKKGYYAMSHIDPLINYVDNNMSFEFDAPLKQIDNAGLNLVSGSCYGFDLSKEIGLSVFNLLKLHEDKGHFKSDSPKHRHDETILSLILRTLNLPVFTFDPLFQSTSPECVIRSGEFIDITPNV